MQQLLAWLDSTELARTVGESLLLTAWLSAFHLIGFTLVMSGGVVSSLRAAGLLLTDLPVQSIARPAFRLVVMGLIVSLPTGFALFAPRATDTAVNGLFQLKMALLLVAAIYQITTSRRIARAPQSPPWLSASGVLGLALWSSLAVAACSFILFE